MDYKRKTFLFQCIESILYMYSFEMCKNFDKSLIIFVIYIIY